MKFEFTCYNEEIVQVSHLVTLMIVSLAVMYTDFDAEIEDFVAVCKVNRSYFNPKG